MTSLCNPKITGKSCPRCKGKGRVIVYVSSFVGRIDIEAECCNCNGTGIVNSPDACEHCKGSGHFTRRIGEIPIKAQCKHCGGTGLKVPVHHRRAEEAVI